MLGVEYSTVGTWLRNGQLVGIKVGKSWRVKESDFRDYIERQNQDIDVITDKTIVDTIVKWVNQPVINKKSMIVSNSTETVKTIMYFTLDHKFFYSEGKLYQLGDGKIITNSKDIK